MTRDIFDTTAASGRGTIQLPLEAQTIEGETDIDDSVQTETTSWLILTVAAPTAHGVQDAQVWFDLKKATTGFGIVESTATIVFRVARTVDGTNWRTSWLDEAVTTAVTGTNAALDAGAAAVLNIGDIPAGESIRIYADMSADATSDIELPFKLMYKSRGTATATAVAAG